jgi:hypothetical protein
VLKAIERVLVSRIWFQKHCRSAVDERASFDERAKCQKGQFWLSKLRGGFRLDFADDRYPDLVAVFMPVHEFLVVGAFL